MKRRLHLLAALALCAPAVACTDENPRFMAKGSGSTSDAAGSPALDGAPDGAPDDAPGDLQELLAARWAFDEGIGTNVADGSGRGNTGTLRGGITWVTNVRPGARAISPYAIELDGVDDYVELQATALPDIESPKTVSLWLFTSDRRETQHNAVSLSNPVSKQGIQIGTNANRLAVWQWIDTVGFMELATPLTPEWHHVAYVFDAAEHRLYLDGVLVAASAHPSHTGKVTSARIGTYLPGREMFRGLLDEVRIYARALTVAEIRALHAGS